MILSLYAQTAGITGNHKFIKILFFVVGIEKFTKLYYNSIIDKFSKHLTYNDEKSSGA